MAHPVTTDLTLPKDTPVKVYLSPKGGYTEAIISEIDQAKTEILVQAYSFTSALIAKALVTVHKRGVKVRTQERAPAGKASSLRFRSRSSAFFPRFQPETRL